MYQLGHPRDREGLSLSEYMHGHGVNLRHIGLLRKLFLEEATRSDEDSDYFIGHCAETSSNGNDYSLMDVQQDCDRYLSSTRAANTDVPNASTIDASSRLKLKSGVEAAAIASVETRVDRTHQLHIPSVASTTRAITTPNSTPISVTTATLLVVGSTPFFGPRQDLSLSHDALQLELFLEALCRTLKNILRDMQRSWMKSLRSSSGALPSAVDDKCLLPSR